MNPSSSSLPLSKRLRLSPQRKVCFVTHFWDYSLDEKSEEYRLFIVDPDSPPNGRIRGDYCRIDPTIRVTGCSGALSFCAIDSILYVFEGNWGERALFPPEGSASKLELSAQVLAGSDYKVEKNDLDRISGMCHTKNIPVALPTPDGKSILVFSSVIYSDSVGAFELYSVADNSWKVLPSLSLPETTTISIGASICIGAYGFLGDFRFLIHTAEVGIFVFDFEKEEWTKLFGAQQIRRKGHFIWIEDGGFCFTPRLAFDVREIDDEFRFSRGHRFPLPSFEPKKPKTTDDDFYIRFPECITLVGYENGTCEVCMLHAEDYISEEQFVCLHLNVCSAEIGKYKELLEDKKETPDSSSVSLNTALVKSVKLLIDVDLLRDSISSSLSLFSI